MSRNLSTYADYELKRRPGDIKAMQEFRMYFVENSQVRDTKQVLPEHTYTVLAVVAARKTLHLGKHASQNHGTHVFRLTSQSINLFSDINGTRLFLFH